MLIYGTFAGRPTSRPGHEKTHTQDLRGAYLFRAPGHGPLSRQREIFRYLYFFTRDGCKSTGKNDRP